MLSVVTIYTLKEPSLVNNTQSSKPELTIECVAEIRIGELLPHPTCIITIQLAQLNYYPDGAEFCPGFDSLLINVSGHLLLLSPVHHQSKGSGTDANFQLHPPTLIASNVERVWMHTTRHHIPHLSRALWINAGCKSMKVFLFFDQKFTINSMSCRFGFHFRNKNLPEAKRIRKTSGVLFRGG